VGGEHAASPLIAPIGGLVLFHLMIVGK